MRQRDVAALDANYTKELADAKAEMMLCVMMLPLVVVGCGIIKAVCQSREATTPPAWIMQLSDWQTPLNGLFHLRERLITMQKQLEGTQKYINEQCR